jgi:hypothetical protein
LLWLFAVLGMLWADVSWTERDSRPCRNFHRLLIIPLLLAQFRRSERGVWGTLWVICFYCNLVALYPGYWHRCTAPGLSTYSHKAFNGVAAKDYISQSALFLICAFRPYLASMRLRCASKTGGIALGLAGLVVLFIANIDFCGDEPNCSCCRSAAHPAARLAAVRMERGGDCLHGGRCPGARGVGKLNLPSRKAYPNYSPNAGLSCDR